MCKKYFDPKDLEGNNVYYGNGLRNFCSSSCQTIYIMSNRKIYTCSWCFVKKYDIDLIKVYQKDGEPEILLCSVNCLHLLRASEKVMQSSKSKCDNCYSRMVKPQYHLAMSDTTLRSFCSHPCVVEYQQQYREKVSLKHLGPPIPVGSPRRAGPRKFLCFFLINNSGGKHRKHLKHVKGSVN